MAFQYKDFYELLNVRSHYEFERKLREIVFKREEREEFYKGLLEINPILSTDTFKPYFELYSAERKTNQQDYTPDEVAQLLSRITMSDAEVYKDAKWSGYDATAGTGTLIINKWNTDRIFETPYSYAPHRYLYRADELGDNAIPYLIHNLAIRGMNAIVVHGDVLTGEAKQVYFIQNSKDDFMAFSDINVMPHTDECMKEFGITKWLEDEIQHIESKKVVANFALPMKRKGIESKSNPFSLSRRPIKITKTLDSFAKNIERAKKGKIYPAGSIIVQLSATNGQTGLLTSSGEVEAHYAVIELPKDQQPKYWHSYIKHNMPRHLHRVKEGLNMTLDGLKEFPIYEVEIEPEELPKFNVTYTNKNTKQLEFMI